MSKVFDYAIDNLSRRSGYSYDTLVDIFMECMEDEGDVDWEYFVDVSMEHDW